MPSSLCNACFRSPIVHPEVLQVSLDGTQWNFGVCGTCYNTHTETCDRCEERCRRSNINYLPISDEYYCNACMGQVRAKSCYYCQMYFRPSGLKKIGISTSRRNQRTGMNTPNLNIVFRNACQSCLDTMQTFNCIDCATTCVDALLRQDNICLPCLERTQAASMPLIDVNVSYDEGHNNLPLHFFDKREFDPKAPIHFGFELEVEFRDYENTRGSLWDSYCNRIKDKVGGGHLMYKRDGSLSGGGLELVSQPMTLNYMHYINIFENIESFKEDLIGFHSSSTGFHVHMSRKNFTPFHFYKFMMFTYKHKDLRDCIAQRANSSYARDPGLTTKDLSHKVYLHAKGRTGERYELINCNNRTTFEMRYFKSNLRADRNYKNIEWLLAVYYFTRQTPPDKLTEDAFFTYLEENKKEYPSLHEYLSARVVYNVITQRRVYPTIHEPKIWNQTSPGDTPILKYLKKKDLLAPFQSAAQPASTPPTTPVSGTVPPLPTFGDNRLDQIIMRASAALNNVLGNAPSVNPYAP